MRSKEEAVKKMQERINAIKASLTIIHAEIDHIKQKKDIDQWDGKMLYMAYRAKEIGDRLLKELTGN